MDDDLHLDAVLARLRAFRKAADLSLSALALAAGLSRAALRGMDDADWAPTSSTIRAVERLIPAGWGEGEALSEAVLSALRAAPAGAAATIAAE